MKLCIHELRAVVQQVHNDDLPPAFKMLSRVGRVQSHMTGIVGNAGDDDAGRLPEIPRHARHEFGTPVIPIPADRIFARRERSAMLEMHRNDPAHYAELQAGLRAPSLYDETLRLLARRGFAIPAAVLERDVTQPVRAESRSRSGVADGLSRDRTLLGSLRTRRKARRRRVSLPEVALRASQNGRACDRLPARHRRHRRRGVPREAAREELLSPNSSACARRCSDGRATLARGCGLSQRADGGTHDARASARARRPQHRAPRYRRARLRHAGAHHVRREDRARRALYALRARAWPRRSAGGDRARCDAVSRSCATVRTGKRDRRTRREAAAVEPVRGAARSRRRSRVCRSRLFGVSRRGVVSRRARRNVRPRRSTRLAPPISTSSPRPSRRARV